MQTNLEIQLIINCGIIYTIKPDFSKFSGDFGGDFGDFSGDSGDFSKSSDSLSPPLPSQKFCCIMGDGFPLTLLVPFVPKTRLG